MKIKIPDDLKSEPIFPLTREHERAVKWPKSLEPVLKPNTLYWADNGRVICRKCAGQSALYTGRDISGQRVLAISPTERRALLADGYQLTPDCTHEHMKEAKR